MFIGGGYVTLLLGVVLKASWLLLVVMGILYIRGGCSLSKAPLWDRDNRIQQSRREFAVGYWLFVLLTNTYLYHNIPEHVTVQAGSNGLGLDEGVFFFLLVLISESILFMALFKNIRIDSFSFVGLYFRNEDPHSHTNDVKNVFERIEVQHYERLIMYFIANIAEKSEDYSETSIEHIVSEKIDTLEYLLKSRNSFIKDLTTMDEDELRSVMGKEQLDDIKKELKADSRGFFISRVDSRDAIFFEFENGAVFTVLMKFNDYAIMNLLTDDYKSVTAFKRDQQMKLIGLVEYLVHVVK